MATGERPGAWDAHGEVWGITRYHDVREVSRNPDLFSSAQGIRPDSGPAPMMIDMDDPEHWKRRKLVNKGFTPRRIRDQQARLTQIGHALVDRIREAGRADFVRDVAAWLPLIVIGDLLGIDRVQRVFLRRARRSPDDATRGPDQRAHAGPGRR